MLLLNKKNWLCVTVVFISVVLSGCGNVPVNEIPTNNRANSISSSAKKITITEDLYPPISHSTRYQKIMPVPGKVNTAGAEDSAFITPRGDTLYFWFTPDPNIPANQQLFDGATGIYAAEKNGLTGDWNEATRIILQDKGKLALDGCVFVQNNKMLFCSTREGYEDMNIFSAEKKNGQWRNWNYVGDKLQKNYDLGELHLSADGNAIYYSSTRAGGMGGMDIWMTKKINGEWQEPINIKQVNSAENEMQPFLTQDGNELWFTRTFQGTPAIFRSVKKGDKWGNPELIISQFAAEPSLDNAGNLYFTHHFYKDSKMLEADIYMAPKNN